MSEESTFFVSQKALSGDIWYFAYGSNLLEAQKTKRSGDIREARACCLPDYRLVFNKPCSGTQTCANIVPSLESEVLGVCFLCTPAALQRIAECEGGYDQVPVFPRDKKTHQLLKSIAFVYPFGVDERAEFRPNVDYLRKITDGLTHYNLPTEYIAQVTEYAHGLPAK